MIHKTANCPHCQHPLRIVLSADLVFVQSEIALAAGIEKRLILIDELELDVRTAVALKAANIKTIGELLRLTRAELLRLPNFGRVSLRKLSDTIAAYGLRLGEDA